ncbi:MAG TPA: hypothetical protein VJO99_13590, partial [Burkholderiaceae bacterium]|nr:hypothetical protein [Burkholderiaceae bacterium]
MTAPRDSNADPREDLPRDAWLREALRHAPDADAAPPAALRDAILRQARAAATIAAPRNASSSPTGWRRRLAEVWSWLTGPRVAAGFASLMVATVVGLMWWDRPIDEGLRRPVEPHAPVTTATRPPAA